VDGKKIRLNFNKKGRGRGGMRRKGKGIKIIPFPKRKSFPSFLSSFSQIVGKGK